MLLPLDKNRPVRDGKCPVRDALSQQKSKIMKCHFGAMWYSQKPSHQNLKHKVYSSLEKDIA